MAFNDLTDFFKNSMGEMNGKDTSRTNAFTVALYSNTQYQAFFFWIIPDSSTTGSADTLLSTKMLSALMIGVSGWMKAMLL